MKIKKLIVCFLIAGTASCQKKNDSKINNQDEIIKNENIMKDESLIKVLIRQIEAGNDQSYSAFADYVKEDLDISIKLIDSILKNNGYKKINDELFIEKIKKIFGRLIDKSSETEYLKIDTYKDNICDKKLEYYPYSVDYQNIYVVKQKKIITYFYPLPQIIDYKKLYPELLKYESEDIIIEDKIENVKIRASQWKDVSDLDQQRKKNIETLVARNMYLFNDSKAHFKWLILNDEYFMRSLVTTFGYYDDTALVEWVTENTKMDAQDLEPLNEIIYNKKCDGKIGFNYTFLKIIAEDQEKATETFNFLKWYYFNWLLNPKNNLELTFSQKAEILARLHSFIFSNMDDYRVYEFMGEFAENYDKDNAYSKEFKAKNYYNIPNFEKQWKEAKLEGDGVSLPGEE